MGFLDFLTEGKAPQAVPVSSTEQSVLPDWYTNYAMDILSNQQALANRAFPLYQGPRVADFTALQQKAFEQTPQAAQAYEPYMAQAGRSAADVTQQFMNPYTDQVVSRIGEMGTRALKEQILPGIEGEMIRAGQFGGTRQAELMGRAIRDATEGISAQQAQALQQGFGQAQQAAQTDLARQAQLASTAGGLGGAQQQALLGAGRGLADIGQTYGALTQAQQQLLTDIGKSSGALTQGQQQLLADIGRSTGQLYGQDTQAQLSAANQLANIAQQRQNQELTGAGALQQIGAQQQALAQRNLDIARSDFLERQAYPQQQLDAMTKTMQGVSSGIPTATQEYGIQPVGFQPQLAPSTAAQVGSVLTGGAALIKEIAKP